MECDGFGYCLATVTVVCTYRCTLRECPNFFVCGSRVPQFMLEFNRGVCNSCVVHFGRTIENPTPSNPVLARVQGDDVPDCPVCLTRDPETGGARGPRCDHYLCLECIRAIYTDPEATDLFPPFPVPEWEEDYYADPNQFIHDDAIRAWRLQVGSWNVRRMQFVRTHRPYLKHCPLCRR